MEFRNSHSRSSKSTGWGAEEENALARFRDESAQMSFEDS